MYLDPDETPPMRQMTHWAPAPRAPKHVKEVLFSTVDINRELSEAFCALDHSAAVIDFGDITQHEIDCQLYGSQFRQHTNDPLTDLFIAMSIPTDYRRYIEQGLYNSAAGLLARVVGPLHPSRTYVVEWLNTATGIIKHWPDPIHYVTHPSFQTPHYTAAQYAG